MFYFIFFLSYLVPCSRRSHVITKPRNITRNLFWFCRYITPSRQRRRNFITQTEGIQTACDGRSIATRNQILMVSPDNTSCILRRRCISISPWICPASSIQHWSVSGWEWGVRRVSVENVGCRHYSASRLCFLQHCLFPLSPSEAVLKVRCDWDVSSYRRCQCASCCL